jgi:hypothetical protein
MGLNRGADPEREAWGRGVESLPFDEGSQVVHIVGSHFGGMKGDGGHLRSKLLKMLRCLCIQTSKVAASPIWPHFLRSPG